MISGGQRLAETLVFSLANVGALVWARQTCKPCLTMFGIESKIQGLVESTCGQVFPIKTLSNIAYMCGQVQAEQEAAQQQQQ